MAYKGLGDLFVILFFGLVAVAGLVYLQTGQWRQESFVLGLQIGFHCTVLIAVNNLRDVEGDAKVNKKTLPVRFGKKFARTEIAFLCFGLLLYWKQRGYSWFCLLPVLVLPLALKLIRGIQMTEPGPIYNRFLGQAAGLHLLFGVLLSVGFCL